MRFNTMSVTSSATSGTVVNSCSTPSIFTEVMAAPCNELKSTRRGNGFRLDHAFATPSLRSRITSCRYSHAERDAGISDHSIMIVEVE